MPCERIGPAIVCSSRGRRPRKVVCVVCFGYASKLCDGPGPRKGLSCDRPLCVTCALHVPPDRDYCPDHRPGTLLEDAVDLVESRLVDPPKDQEK